MERKKTLLEKFEIPLQHLDFAYIAKCENAREMEKIVQILRSGEEGYFPDLTKCAEDKLRELKPQSRHFRIEEKLQGRETLGAHEWKPIYNWTHDIKTKDRTLASLQTTSQYNELQVPAIRKMGKITTSQEQSMEIANRSELENSSCSSETKECVKSTDYGKWDKYDADVEVLRMDLAEERAQEEVERMNRLNLQKSKQTPKIMEIQSESQQAVEQCLTDIEREKLAEDYRLRGNEYFRAKEYENAIEEYNRSIKLHAATAAAAYNNRAIAKIKLQKFSEAIDDCLECLQREPQNVKALLRQAEATYHLDKKRAAYDLYGKVLELDAENHVALKAINELRSELGELPPATATRLQIQEIKSTTSEKLSKNNCITKSESSTTASTKKPMNSKEYDLANLIVPNRMVKNKWAIAAENIQNLHDSKNTNKTAKPMKANSTEEAAATLRLPIHAAKPTGKLLIEEI